MVSVLFLFLSTVYRDLIDLNSLEGLKLVMVVFARTCDPCEPPSFPISLRDAIRLSSHSSALRDDGAGSSAVVAPGRRQNTDRLVVPSKAVDAGLDKTANVSERVPRQ